MKRLTTTTAAALLSATAAFGQTAQDHMDNIMTPNFVGCLRDAVNDALPSDNNPRTQSVTKPNGNVAFSVSKRDNKNNQERGVEVAFVTDANGYKEAVTAAFMNQSDSLKIFAVMGTIRVSDERIVDSARDHVASLEETLRSRVNGCLSQRPS